MKVICVLLFAATLLGAAAPRAITLIYTGDLHGELLPSLDWTVPGDPKPELGGLDRLATLIKTERANGPCLVLDAGDFASGSPEANRTSGIAMIDLMNRLGYDAVCVGEQDFACVTGQPDTVARHARFRLLGERWLTLKARVDVPVTRPSLVKEVAGVKVGIIGLLDESLIERENSDTGLVSPGLSPEQVLAREIKALHSQNADLIVVLAHATADRCRQLAARFPDVTAFICAHDGLVMEPKNAARVLPPVVLEAGRRGQRAGVCQVYLDSARHVAGIHNRIANLLPARLAEDTPIHNVVSGLLSSGLDDSLAGSSIELLPGISGRSPLGDWVAENAAAGIAADTRQAKTGTVPAAAPAAVILPFSALDWALLKGTATGRALRRIAPYDEKLVRVRLSEVDIARVLDELLDRDDVHPPSTSGITYDIVRPDSGTPQVKTRAINVKLAGQKTDVVLPLWLALSSGLPSRNYQAVSRSFGDLLILAVKTLGVRPPPGQSAAPTSQSTTPGTKTQGKVNINTATVDELEGLPGIGPAFAKRIIEYREQHGAFAKIEDIMNVKGLAQKRFERVKDRITVQ